MGFEIANVQLGTVGARASIKRHLKDFPNQCTAKDGSSYGRSPPKGLSKMAKRILRVSDRRRIELIPSIAGNRRLRKIVRSHTRLNPHEYQTHHSLPNRVTRKLHPFLRKMKYSYVVTRPLVRSFNMGLRTTTALFAFMMAIGILTGLRLSHAEPTTTAQANTSVTGIISQVSGDRITLKLLVTPSASQCLAERPSKSAVSPPPPPTSKSACPRSSSQPTEKPPWKFAPYPPTTTKPTTHPTTEPTTKPTTRPTTEPANHNYTGVITQVNGDGITIQSSGHTTTFKITSSTTIKIGDHVGTVADLKVGMSALVVSSGWKNRD